MTNTLFRLTEAGRIGLRMLLNATELYRADRRGLHLLGMEDVVDLPDDWTEPVPPPLPPEPEPGAYLIGTVLAVRERADMSGNRWYWWLDDPGDFIADSWANCWEAFGGAGTSSIVRLVPAPEPVQPVLTAFGKPLPLVTLPWHLTSINGWGRGEVRLAQDNPAAPIAYSIDDYTRFISTSQAREMAAALLSAADEAERANG